MKDIIANNTSKHVTAAIYINPNFNGPRILRGACNSNRKIKKYVFLVKITCFNYFAKTFSYIINLQLNSRKIFMRK